MVCDGTGAHARARVRALLQPPLDSGLRIDPAKPVHTSVLLYGYLVETIGAQRTSCQVTCVSQMGT